MHMLFFCEITEYLMVGCHGNLYLNNWIIFIFSVFVKQMGLARICIIYAYFCL